MPEIKTTRLRHISAKDLGEIEVAIEKIIPAKIEIKQTVFKSGRWYVIFTIPDNLELKSVDL